MLRFKLILAACLLAIVVVFALQNAEPVQVRFLLWSVTISQALLIFLTGALGAITGFILPTAFRQRRQQ